MSANKDLSSIFWKWFSLLIFLFQNSINPIMFRFAMTGASAKTRYSTPVAIFLAEVLKAFLSACLVVLEEGCSIRRGAALLWGEVVLKPRSTLMLAVPAVCYAVQNLVMQLSAAHLPAPVWHVLYQSKLLVTAVFAMVLLNRRFRRAQWLAMGAMGFGLAVVQLSKAEERRQATMANAREQNVFIGLSLLAVGCMASGFGSIYFERIVKSVDHGMDEAGRSKKPSLWVQNVQLAVFSMAITVWGVVPELTNAGHPPEISALGPPPEPGLVGKLLHGFTPTVWLLVLNNAVGGLLVALTIKYADSMLRGFAAALATVLGTILSVICFGFVLRLSFAWGTALVLSSSLLYGGVFKLPGSWWEQEWVPGACLARGAGNAVAPRPGLQLAGKLEQV